MNNYRLQKYEDGSYGYLGIDGDEKYNLKTESPVVCMQGEDEDREDFINKNGITFSNNQYGSNEKLDKEVNDRDWCVRRAVARQEYGLDKLVNDEDWEVRLRVAKWGYGLDKLINDENANVREEIAKQGYGLDKLVYDRDSSVRRVVASHGYGLDKLVYDRSPDVREEVAKQGYGLEILLNDKIYWVALAAEDYLTDHRLYVDKMTGKIYKGF